MVEGLIKAASEYLPSLDKERLERAYRFAEEAHRGQIRKDGKTPYVVHPLDAAKILTELHVDEDTLIACLLHDVPEDTKRSIKDVEKAFGKTVAFLVEGITKLSKVHYRHDMLERQVDSLKKLFIHSANDPRIILIKLADRLHNMQTIDAIESAKKRERIAMETLEIFVPIANLLGIWELKYRLEDLCFEVLYPSDFKKIDRMIKRSATRERNLIERTVQEVTELFEKRGITSFKVEGREKTYYRIYRKMLNTGKSFKEIYDLIGLRVIVPDAGACYQVLGTLHQRFTPKPGRLKDYIATPKSNGYQSIHTTVFGIGGVITEFQIRTHEMHLENEYGIAAHFFYTEGQRQHLTMKKRIEDKYEWIQKILDLQRDVRSNTNFLKDLKLDIFTDRIFVFTPKGDVIDLPVGAIVIDFAYGIHTDVGSNAVEALVNGKKVSLESKLKNGDVVEVITYSKSEGPQVAWLNIVKTSIARHRIRDYLREKDRTALAQEAEQLLKDNLKSIGFKGLVPLPNSQKKLLIDSFGMNSWDALLNEIGNGTISVQDVVRKLFIAEELFGKVRKPVNIGAYKHLHGHGLSQHTPEKVHKITILVETKNHVGVLGDICGVLAEEDVNILRMNAITEQKPGRAEIKIVAEVKDFDQYDRAVRSIRKLHGIVNVRHVMNTRRKKRFVAKVSLKNESA